MGLVGRNDFNSHQLARIGQKKIFHELDVHHAHIVVIKGFLAQEYGAFIMSKFKNVNRTRRFESNNV